MKPHIIGFIFARGGSKGIPRKNIRLLGGKPLIAYSIEAARASRFIERVIVSTDDPEIAEIAQQYGAEVPFIRPAELAQDNSPEWSAWQHAVRSLSTSAGTPGLDVFVSIPTTSPLRSGDDLDACIQALVTSDADLVFTVKPAGRSPYYNMVVLDEAGYASLVIPPPQVVPNRQDSPPVYDMTTVAYAARPAFILRANSLFEGKAKAVVVSAESGLDIDTELDFKFAEFLLSQTSA